MHRSIHSGGTTNGAAHMRFYTRTHAHTHLYPFSRGTWYWCVRQFQHQFYFPSYWSLIPFGLFNIESRESPVWTAGAYASVTPGQHIWNKIPTSVRELHVFVPTIRINHDFQASVPPTTMCGFVVPTATNTVCCSSKLSDRETPETSILACK